MSRNPRLHIRRAIEDVSDASPPKAIQFGGATYRCVERDDSELPPGFKLFGKPADSQLARSSARSAWQHQALVAQQNFSAECFRPRMISDAGERS